MPHRFAAALILLVSAPAWAADVQYQDGATSAWFKGLRVDVPGANLKVSCCDQSDCRQTKAEWMNGGWWAASRQYPGEWVRVPDANVVKEPNPLLNAVLCEAFGGRDEFKVLTVPSGKIDFLYCFVPPPQGF